LIAIFANTMDELRVKMIGFYHDHCYHHYFGPIENVPEKLKYLVTPKDKKFVFIFEEDKPIHHDTQIQNTEN